MTNETQVTPAPEPVMASRDREAVEIVETVEIVQPDAPEIVPEDARSEIYARHSERRDEENNEIVVETTEAEPIISESEPVVEAQEAPGDVVQVKIMGDIRSVSKEKIAAMGGMENYQIRIAAKEQMERNAHERAALAARQIAQDERERQLAEKEAALPALDTRAVGTPERLTPPDSQNLEEIARRYQEAVYDDDSEAPSILVSMVRSAAASGETFDKDAFRKQVREDVLQDQRQAKIVKAGRSLIEAHPELNMRDEKFDQRMYDNIDGETMVVARERPDWEPDQVAQEAYDRISNWKGGTPPSKTMSDKQAMKRDMAHPRTGTARFTPPPPPPRATKSDYVAEERKRRGLD